MEYPYQNETYWEMTTGLDLYNFIFNNLMTADLYMEWQESEHNKVKYAY